MENKIFYDKLQAPEDIKALKIDKKFVIYEPNDDSFLFLFLLYTEIMTNNLKLEDSSFILEVGFGTGFIINNFVNILKKNNINTINFAIDINIDACMKTKEFLDNSINVINMDLLSNLKKKKFDLIFFNPPYVPTDNIEYANSLNNIKLKQNLFNNYVKNNNLESLNEVNLYSNSYAGGKNGNEIILKFIKNVHEYLSDKGIFYLLIDSVNDTNLIIKQLKLNGFSEVNIMCKERYHNEELIIIKSKK